MTLDPTAEMKRIRHKLGANANFDLDRIFADLRWQQENSGRTYVRLPHRKFGSTDLEWLARPAGRKNLENTSGD